MVQDQESIQKEGYLYYPSTKAIFYVVFPKVCACYLAMLAQVGSVPELLAAGEAALPPPLLLPLGLLLAVGVPVLHQVTPLLQLHLTPWIQALGVRYENLSLCDFLCDKITQREKSNSTNLITQVRFGNILAENRYTVPTDMYTEKDSDER